MTRKRPPPPPPDSRQMDLFGATAPKPPEPSAPRPAPSPEPQLELIAAPPPPPPELKVVENAPVADLGEVLRLERNLALLAGAGAGKTHSLVTMCLHLLGGARRDWDAISPAKLGLLTFTEKAADEMRGRLRDRLDGLALGTAEEPALRASFEAAGKPFPKGSVWRGIRDDLGGATIGTFHSLCSQLLRRAPPNARVSAGFDLLEEREASALMFDVVERALLARLERGSTLRALVAELGFSRLVGGLVPVATRIREEGIAPDFVPVADYPTLRAQFDANLRGLKVRARSAQPATPTQLKQLDHFKLELDVAEYDTFERDGEALAAALKNARDQVGDLRQPVEELRKRWVACQLAPQEAEVRELLTEVFAAHEEALTRRGVLDFTGLLIEARNLLRDSAEARTEAQARFGALLVDEFQDTNRLQLEIVLLLAEKREHAPRPVSTAFDEQHREIVALPQEHGFLAVVGDRKQSIYEFRGADVSVFEVMARAIEKNDGRRAFLRHSRRSTPALLTVFNEGFARTLVAPPEQEAADFEVVWQNGEDDLLPVREQSAPGQAVMQLADSRLPQDKIPAEQFRNADAEAMAAALEHGLAAARSPVAWKLADGSYARGGNVAVLFQRFTQLEVYRQALVRHGIRHRVVRGRGFYGAQEIVDLACLLSLLADPDDAIALSAVLRSPLVGLTDAEWIALARPTVGQRWKLEARKVLFGSLPNGVAPEGFADPDAPDALQRFRERFHSLREARDRLGLRALLRVIYEEFAFRVAVAASPFGEQAVANLDKLLVLATARERQGSSVAQFSAELMALAEEAPREAQAEVIDELDPDAVTLCTVHQAKGLEWPIVVLPDLNVAPRSETAAVRFDREYGLGIQRPKGESEIASFSAEAITKQLSRRARAEHARLLYVAMTRARDRVILGLRPANPQERTWAKDLTLFFPLQVIGVRPWELDVSQLRALPAVAPSKGAIDLAPLEKIIDTVRAPHRPVSRALVLPVTQLQDHTSCPRRYHLAHQVGLTERHTGVGAMLPDELEGDARDRGVAAHRLLEVTPLELIGSSQLSARLRGLRRAEGLEREVTDDVLSWVERFWQTSFAREFKDATAVHRELPFALRVDLPPQPSLVLRGQIDLLVERRDELIVVDYKTTPPPPSGVEPWRAQLACYAIAARRLSGRALPVRAGIVFLRETNPEPRFLASLDVPRLEASLIEEAAELERSQRTGRWTGRERAQCESLGCGYVYRCHP
ncbi:MAG: UvrD-helicase domain-containing protein [Archangium sp.]|nr:UvrD-helicase domain-containing protein [Archangium sp.]